MRVKAIVDEDFVNYKKSSMFIATCFCDWKCCTEGGFDKSVCQNSPTAQQPNIEISYEEIFKRYISNPITSAVVVGGLEPFRQFSEILSLISFFRSHGCQDDFVIYTGYTADEIMLLALQLTRFQNIIVKFGRYVPGDTPHFDEVLGVNLANREQYARRIS